MNKFLERNATLVVSLSLIVLAIAARVFHVMDNFSPIGAIALFVVSQRIVQKLKCA